MLFEGIKIFHETKGARRSEFSVRKFYASGVANTSRGEAAHIKKCSPKDINVPKLNLIFPSLLDLTGFGRVRFQMQKPRRDSYACQRET